MRGLNPFRGSHDLLKCPWARNWSPTWSINRRNKLLMLCLVTFISIGGCVPANTLFNPFSGKSRAFANNPYFTALVQDRRCSLMKRIPRRRNTLSVSLHSVRDPFNSSCVSIFFLFCFVKGLKLFNIIFFEMQVLNADCWTFDLWTDYWQNIDQTKLKSGYFGSDAAFNLQSGWWLASKM